MKWNANYYYPIKEILHLPEVSTTLHTLMDYHRLTQVSVDLLGNDLLEKLQFGFFSSGTKIITEGNEDRDLFLLCQGQVDIFLKQQLILQIVSPALWGEHALIAENNKRFASMVVSENNTALVLKIPLASFLHDLNSRFADYL